MRTMTDAELMEINQVRTWSSRLIRAGRVTAGDVAQLRNEIFPLGLVGRGDAEALFEVDRAVLDKSAGWNEVFVELVVDFLVWGNRPTGTVESEQAEWLVAQVDRLTTAAGLFTLASLLEEAQVYPSWFPAAVRGRVAQDWRRVTGPAELRAA